VPVVDMGDAHDVLIATHAACSVCGFGPVTCTLESWDLEACTSLLLWRFLLGRSFLQVLREKFARQLFLAHSLLHSGTTGLLVSYPEGMVSCRPGQALALELRVFYQVECLLQCGCGCVGRRILLWRRAASACLLVSFPEGKVSCNPGHAPVLVLLVFCWARSAGGVESRRGGGLGLPWIKLM